MSFKPIKVRKIYAEIVEQIKDLIKDGKLSSGDKLPTLKELAEDLKVGQSAVREALTVLEAMGIVEIRQGGGAYIRQTQLDDTIEPLSMMLLLERDLSLEVLHVRKFLEVGAAGLAARQRTEEELAKMEKALMEMEKDILAGNLGERADWDFHFAVAEASRNSLLIRLMHTVADNMKISMKANRRLLFEQYGMPKRLYDEHKKIYQAIKQQNSTLAEQMMYDHLHRVELYMGDFDMIEEK
ncbi:FadR/GntR family transcriptional regulator [Desulfuribacillus alkaliarsenatis]|uniref:GntR family transcriptional regulator n=1 Tax=Desulfuribacillus alkaliarsenatis TaxID=766136 RepID=A0A1E5FYL4_9FIRM|nr:FadR/GntR family transcriptional regulator [Desulfuribacillus alkaliarsenatis]OEF95662.1 GntR family transcriptional regulator [Desulfuribacillus alkaliarsenatis]